jgi:phosphoenolpyruvate synthase/pyruvate phosphate dikinase
MKKIISGRVTIIRSEKDYYKINKPVVLVARNTHPDVVIAIKKIKAIVTEIDNRLCHAAIIAREYDIPLLMGMENATKEFKTGDKVIVDFNRKMICKMK